MMEDRFDHRPGNWDISLSPIRHLMCENDDRASINRNGFNDVLIQPKPKVL
jgi:hypothetical protein